MMFLRNVFLAFAFAAPLAAATGERELLTKIQTAFQGVDLRTDIDIKGLVDINAFHDVILRRLNSKLSNLVPPCAPSKLDVYVDGLFATLNKAELEALSGLMSEGVDFLPFVSVLLKARFPGNDVFHPNAQQGAEYAKRLAISRKFWDVNVTALTLYSVSGKFFNNTAVMVPAAEFMYEVDTATAQALVDTVQQTFKEYPKIGYNFPLWSLNAAALGDFGDEFPEVIGDNSILMGDGLIMFLESQGLSNAKYWIFSHEYSHILQFKKNMPQLDEMTPDSSRYIELLADAMGAYFSRHGRGGALSAQHIFDSIKASYGIGDCYVDSYGHHGTPTQRLLATSFTTLLYETSRNKTQILSSNAFIKSFDARYRDIVKVV